MPGLAGHDGTVEIGHDGIVGAGMTWAARRPFTWMIIAYEIYFFVLQTASNSFRD